MTVNPHLPDGVTEFDPLAGGSLSRAWSAHMTDAPQRLAVVDSGGARRLTYGEMDVASRAAAARLGGAGLQAGDRVLLSATASVDLVIAFVAALRLGLVIVPMNTAYTDREIRHIVDDVRPAGAIVDDPARVAGSLEGVAHVWTPGLEGADAVADVAGLLDRTTAEDLALIAYTSGTTGAPKGAMLSSGNLLASANALRAAWRWSAEDVLVLALPLFHIHGLGVGLCGSLVAGASVVLVERFSVDAVLDAAERFDASLFFGVPTMYVRLAESDRVDEVRALRLCVSGSAPLAPDVHRTIAARGGQVVLERYGMTETVMNVSNPFDGERRAGSVGLPLPGVQLRLDAESSEIQVRGPNVFSGYWERPEANAAAFTADGWFRTGDLGVIDDGGYVRINGRAKELIITGGYNVYPREVEEVLREAPGVADVAVAGVPSEEWGEVVGAWVVAGPGWDEAAVGEFAAGQLAAYKRPRAFTLIDELPRNALGKVLKHELPRGST